MSRASLKRAGLAAALLAGVAAATPCEAEDGSPQAYRGLTAIAIPYANGPIQMDHVPKIWLRLSGSEPRRFGMDTGSTGIVVSSEHYIPGPNDIDDGPGQLTYSSSGRVLHGTHWTTDIEIMQGRERPAATARVQVLRVERITCLPNARDCEPRERPRGVSYMGIGFGRSAAQGTAPTAQRNPFIALTALASGLPASSVRPGYILTRDDLHLGMTPELTRNFAFVKLAPKETGGAVPDSSALGSGFGPGAAAGLSPKVAKPLVARVASRSRGAPPSNTAGTTGAWMSTSLAASADACGTTWLTQLSSV